MATEPIRSLDEAPDAPADAGRRRLLALGGAAGLGLVGLAAQLFGLQVVRGADYRRLADENRFRLEPVAPPRGVIADRNGEPLARNRPSYAVAVVPADLPRPSDPVVRRLAHLLGVPAGEIAAAVRRRAGDPFAPVPVRTNVEPGLAYAVEERRLELPGVRLVVQPVREYPDGALASHVVGFVGRLDAEEYARLRDDQERGYGPDDRIGKAGLELVREAELRGRPGQRRSEVDSSGREVRVLGLDPPRPGRDLTLTLDLALQREVSRVLGEELARFGSASAVALDPRDGRVLAQVHLPAYDNNLFSRPVRDEELAALLDDPRRPLVDGALAAAHPPGSVFKLVTAVGALEAGVVRATTRLECTGALLVPNRLAPGGVTRFPCWAVHGWQDCATALANSCNVFFYQAGGGDPRGEWDGLGIDRLAEWARRFGLGAPTGVELPGEVGGLVPDPAWKRRTLGEAWFTGDTYQTAIGQGAVTLTPLQLATVVAALANGGRLHRPQVVLGASDGRGDRVGTFRPELVRDLALDPEKLGVVRRGLRYGLQIGRTDNETSYVGTAWMADLRDLAVAGKTGTAEYGAPGPDGVLPTHGWFAGYAPFESPQLALSVFVERGEGGRDAARLARRIFAYYFGVADA